MMTNETKNLLKFWAKVTAAALVYALLAGQMAEWDQEAALFEAYANGVAEGIAIEDKINKQRQAGKAMQWWVGSDDMLVVRDRLCSNYNRPKVK